MTTQFLKAYKASLAVEPNYVSPWTKEQAFRVTAIDHVESEFYGPSTRNVTIQVDHPGLIWTGKCSLRSAPPRLILHTSCYL